MKTIIYSAFLFISTFTVSLYSTDYSVDTVHSSVGFSIKHNIVATTRGTFGSFIGEFSTDKKGKLSAINGTVTVSSIDTANDKRDAHLRNPDFFEVDKYPEMKLVFKNYKGDKTSGTLEAELTIKNITKVVPFKVELSEEVTTGKGKKVIGLSLSTTINRKDFTVGTSFASALISENVNIQIDLEGHGK